MRFIIPFVGVLTAVGFIVKVYLEHKRFKKLKCPSEHTKGDNC